MRDGAAVFAGDEPRARLARSIALAARTIAPSLGPAGRGVLFHRPPAAPALLQDGYQIARELADEAGAASIGARIVKETLFDVDRDPYFTALGVQVFDPTGRLCGVLPKPQADKPLTSVMLSGANREYLYAMNGDKIKSPNPPRTAVLPEWNGSQAKPILGSKSRLVGL